MGIRSNACVVSDADAGEVLELTVNYSVTDSDGASDQAAFTLTLTGTNDAPKLTGLQSSLPGGSEDNPYAITKNQLLAGFSDADDGESLTLDISDLVATDDNGASVGSFELNSTDTGWTFTPNANFNGNVNLSYKVTDGIDSTDAANSFNLAAVNDVPALTGVKASLTAGTEDTAYTIATSDLLTGYTDADTGETETLVILGLSASNGFITKVPDTDNYTFTPNPDFNGEVTLNYVVSDGKGGNFLATNAFNIQAVNDKPVRTAGNVSTLFLIEDQPLASMGLAGLNYSVSGGIDEADQTLTYTITELPDSSKGVVYLADGTTAVTAQQTLSLEELRTLTFLPAENAAGQTTFSFSVTDSGDGDNSITETVNLDILGFNDTPILPTTAIAISDAQEDVAYTFSPADLLAGVTDPDVVYDAEGNITSRDVDNLNVINLSVTNGELTYDADNDQYTFTPDDNFNGVARFNYLITDGNGGSVSNTVSLNVVAINDTPEATFSTNQFTAEGNSAISGQLTSTDIDKKAADGSGDPESEHLLPRFCHHHWP